MLLPHQKHISLPKTHSIQSLRQHQKNRNNQKPHPNIPGHFRTNPPKSQRGMKKEQPPGRQGHQSVLHLSILGCLKKAQAPDFIFIDVFMCNFLRIYRTWSYKFGKEERKPFRISILLDLFNANLCRLLFHKN